MRNFSEIYLKELTDSLSVFPHNQFERFIDTLISAYDMQNNIFIMGNGGSASTASHWTCDINKGCNLNNEKRFRMICLNDNIATILAYANDVSYNDIFVEQLRNFFRSGDVVIAISGTGNSANVLKAIRYANENGGITVGLCGFNGGELYRIVDIAILAKTHDMQKVEDVHTIVSHMTMQRLCEVLGEYQSVDLVHGATG